MQEGPAWRSPSLQPCDHGESGPAGTRRQRLHRTAARRKPSRNPSAAIHKDWLESELFVMSAARSPARRRCGAGASRATAHLFSMIGDMTADCKVSARAVGRSSIASAAPDDQANVRVIAATHQELEVRVKHGLFREDLFHRLNVIRLRLPPLRERREDIPLLAKHFLAKSARELGVEAKRLSDAALKFLSAQDFPGNVRHRETCAIG